MSAYLLLGILTLLSFSLSAAPINDPSKYFQCVEDLKNHSYPSVQTISYTQDEGGHVAVLGRNCMGSKEEGLFLYEGGVAYFHSLAGAQTSNGGTRWMDIQIPGNARDWTVAISSGGNIDFLADTSQVDHIRENTGYAPGKNAKRATPVTASHSDCGQKAIQEDLRRRLSTVFHTYQCAQTNLKNPDFTQNPEDKNRDYITKYISTLTECGKIGDPQLSDVIATELKKFSDAQGSALVVPGGR